MITESCKEEREEEKKLKSTKNHEAFHNFFIIVTFLTFVADGQKNYRNRCSLIREIFTKKTIQARNRRFYILTFMVFLT